MREIYFLNINYKSPLKFLIIPLMSVFYTLSKDSHLLML